MRRLIVRHFQGGRRNQMSVIGKSVPFPSGDRKLQKSAFCSSLPKATN
jgi:hypothetical protein